MRRICHRKSDYIARPRQKLVGYLLDKRSTRVMAHKNDPLGILESWSADLENRAIHGLGHGHMEDVLRIVVSA